MLLREVRRGFSEEDQFHFQLADAALQFLYPYRFRHPGRKWVPRYFLPVCFNPEPESSIVDTGTAACGPPLSASGLRPRRLSVAGCGVVAEPGGPAEAERAVDQHLVPADGDVGGDLEVGPAQPVLDLLVALSGPVPDPLDPHPPSKG